MTHASKSPIDGRFHLTDHFGKPVTEESYRDRHLLVFFGFTHCRVVCPRALDRLSKVLDRLGPAADRIQPLYITVDPDRDSPAVMQAFLENRYPRVIGLTGTKDEIDYAKRAFRVFAERRKSDLDEGGYDVPHTAITYLMSPSGDYLDHFSDVATADDMVERIRRVTAR